jgi:polyisoprenoid-binding protein YceI
MSRSERGISSAAILAACIAVMGCGDPEAIAGPRSATEASTGRLQSSSVRFTISKWADAEGTMRIPVSGVLDAFHMELSDGARLTRLQELRGLTGTVHIDLTSLRTELEVRDQNIMDTFFEVSRFDSATFAFKNVRPQGKGPSGWVLADGTLSLHGVGKELKDIALDVTRRDDGWDVRTRTSLMIRTDDYGLAAQALLAVCGHAGIDPAASVDVELHIMDLTARQGEG